MKIKLFFLLIFATGIVQEIFCNVSSVFRITLMCSLCSRPLTSDEIHFNLIMHKNKTQFICQKCHMRGKEEDELIIAQAAEEKLQDSIALPAISDDSIFNDTSFDTSLDNFYGNQQARKLIDEAIWELSPSDINKERRKFLARDYKKKVFLIKKDKKKKGVEDNPRDLGFAQGKWVYTLPCLQVGGCFELQVANGQDFFTSFSKTPVYELWCQGPKSVVVAEDGYTYFDREKNEQIFFEKKEDLLAHKAFQGFNFEFKVLLKPVAPIVHVPHKKDLVLEKIFADYKKGIDEIFENYPSRGKEVNKVGSAD